MSNVKVHIIGRLGADAEVKQSKKGKEFITFNIAVDDFIQGNKMTTWFTVADFTENASKRASYLKKGSLIEVQGIETCRIYMDRNKTPQIARDIRSTHIDFVISGKGTTDSKEQKEEPQETVAATTTTSAPITDVDDDLPF